MRAPLKDPIDELLVVGRVRGLTLDEMAWLTPTEIQALVSGFVDYDRERVGAIRDYVNAIMAWRSVADDARVGVKHQSGRPTTIKDYLLDFDGTSKKEEEPEEDRDQRIWQMFSMMSKSNG